MPVSAPTHRSLGTLPFLGREAELSTLCQHYSDAYNGARITVWVVGEIGSGKSRLVDEFIQTERLRGTFVVRARLNNETDAVAILATAVMEALELRPALRRQLEIGLATSLTSIQLSSAVGSALQTIARRLPLVVVLDDADASNEHFPAALGSLLRDIDGAFMLVGTIRPTYEERMQTVATIADADVALLPLEPISGEVQRGMIEAMFNVQLTTDDAAWLAEATQGLPMLFRSVVSALLRSGCLAMIGGAWQRVHPCSLCSFSPAEALPLFGQTLLDLPNDERSALTTVALLGRRCTLADAALLGLPDGWHLPLAARNLIRCSGSTVEFHHELLYQAAADEATRLGITAEQRATFLSVWNATIEQGTIIPQLPLRTLLSVVESATDDVESKAVLSTIAAMVEFANGSRQFPQGLPFAKVCRKYWKELRIVLPDGKLAQLTTRCSNVFYQLGYVDQQQEVIQELLAEHSANPPHTIVPLVVDALIIRTEYLARKQQSDEAIACLNQAEALLARITSISIRRNCRLNIAMHRATVLRHTDRGAEATALLEQVITECGTAEFSPELFSTVLELSGMPQSYTRPVERRARIQWMLTLCEHAGVQHLREATQMRILLVTHDVAEGNYHDAEQKLQTLIRESRRWYLPRTESNIWYWLAVVHAERGNYHEAIRAIDECLRIRRRVYSIALWQVAMLTKAQMLTDATFHTEAIAVLDELDADAAGAGRTYRRFIAHWCRAMAAVCSNATIAPTMLEELWMIGRQEEHEGVEPAMLELEGRMLLHSTTIQQTTVEEYLSRAQHFTALESTGRMMKIIAAVLANRTVVRKKGKGEPSLRTETRRQAIQVLQFWQSNSMPGKVSLALQVIQKFAPTLFDTETFAQFTADVARVPDARPEIISFGRLRVLDTAGTEQGGRHFGTQKGDSKPRKMLAALVAALLQQRPLSRERLIEMVWGEEVNPEVAANNFHVTLSGLRQAVGDAVEFDGAAYCLNTTKLRIDAIEFLRLLDEAASNEQQGRIYQSFDLLQQSCALYQGELLEGIYDAWSDAPRDQLRRRFRTALLRLAPLALSRGNHDTARMAVTRLMELDPFDEEAFYHHLTILVAEGERPRALRDYTQFAQMLNKEYGIEPSRQLRELKGSIAAG